MGFSRKSFTQARKPNSNQNNKSKISIDDKLDSKRQLLNKIKANRNIEIESNETENPKEQVEKDSNNINYEELFKKERKKNKKLSKSIEDLNNDISNLKSSLRNVNKAKTKQSEENFNLKEELKERRIEVNTLKEELTYKDLKEKQILKEVESFKSLVKTLEEEKERIRVNWYLEKQRVKSFRGMVNNESAISKRDRQITILSHELKRVRGINSKSIDTIKDLDKELVRLNMVLESPEQLINHLIIKINAGNIRKYIDINRLSKKYEELVKLVDVYKETELPQDENMIMYGALTRVQEEYVFRNVEGVYYHIDLSTEEAKRMKGQPIKVEVVDERNVLFVKNYNIKVKKVNKIVRYKVKNKRSSIVDKLTETMKGYKVGVLGSKAKNYYNYLDRRKVDVSWSDPFSMSYGDLVRFINGHDIVLGFYDSIPHLLLTAKKGFNNVEILGVGHSTKEVTNKLLTWVEGKKIEQFALDKNKELTLTH